MRHSNSGASRIPGPKGLRLVIGWHYVTATLAVTGIIGVFWLVWPKLKTLDGLDYYMGMTVFVMVIWWLVLKIALSSAATIGILKAREWGRQTAIVHAALTLLFVPVGIVVGTIVIFYMNKPRVKEYFIRG